MAATFPYQEFMDRVARRFASDQTIRIPPGEYVDPVNASVNMLTVVEANTRVQICSDSRAWLRVPEHTGTAILPPMWKIQIGDRSTLTIDHIGLVGLGNRAGMSITLGVGAELILDSLDVTGCNQVGLQVRAVKGNGARVLIRNCVCNGDYTDAVRTMGYGTNLIDLQEADIIGGTMEGYKHGVAVSGSWFGRVCVSHADLGANPKAGFYALGLRVHGTEGNLVEVMQCDIPGGIEVSGGKNVLISGNYVSRHYASTGGNGPAISINQQWSGMRKVEIANNLITGGYIGMAVRNVVPSQLAYLGILGNIIRPANPPTKPMVNGIQVFGDARDNHYLNIDRYEHYCNTILDTRGPYSLSRPYAINKLVSGWDMVGTAADMEIGGPNYGPRKTVVLP